MRNILIRRINHECYEVIVTKKEVTKHIVHVSDSVHNHFTEGKMTKEQFVKKAFLFLLQREQNTSILKEFQIEMIAKFFPDFRKISTIGWIDLSV